MSNEKLNAAVMRVFIALLRSTLTGAREEIALGDVDLESLYALAKAHDLAHIVCGELQRRGQLPAGETGDRFKKQYDLAVFRHIRRETAMTEVRGILENEKIPFVLLKGAVLMDLYPEPWTRTSSDIDVLVREADYDRVNRLFAQNGMEKCGEYLHEFSFTASGGYHVETHDGLIEDTNNASAVLSRVWDHAAPKGEGKAEHVLDDAMFYFYHVAHMAKHFQNGGSGVRTLMDTWLLHHAVPFDQTARDALLIEGGLQTFEKNVHELSEIWFSGAERDGSFDDLEAYIVGGGTYGTTEQNVAVQMQKTQSRFRYYWHRIFLPYRYIKYQYPVLKKVPVLLPFCWVLRWCKLLDPRVRKKAKQEIGIERQLDPLAAARTAALMQQLEIR